MRTRLVRVASTAALLLASVCVAGCKTGYSAYINNNTSQPVIAKLIDTRAKQLLASDRIGPNSKTALEVGQIPEGNEVILEVDNQGNPGYPPTLRLLPGRTVVNVVEESQTARAKIHLEVVPR
ncbi:MAG: hypothetical protein AB7G11_03110 [Phycisphaerales bacterium]